MRNIEFIYSKLLKKIRGRSIRNSDVDKSSRIFSGTEFYNSKLGRMSYVGYDSQIHNCEIGAFCSIANYCIIGGSEHPMEWISTSPAFQAKKRPVLKKSYGKLQVTPDLKTIIENDVWIGSRVIIKQGVTIHTGAVVGAGSVVTKDVEPYAIVAGTPAKMIRKRFDDITIDQLLNSKWWLFSNEKLENLSLYMNQPNIFLEKISEF